MSAVNEPKFFLTDGPPADRDPARYGGTGPLKLDPPVVGGTGSHRRRGGGLRRGGPPDRGRLGGLLALRRARPVRRATAAPVRSVSQGPGHGLALPHPRPGPGRRAGPDLRRSSACRRRVLTEVPRENVTAHPHLTAHHRALSQALRIGATASAVLPGRAEAAITGLLERQLQQDAPAAPAAHLGGTAGADPAVRGRHTAAGEHHRRELRRLASATLRLRRPRRLPAVRAAPGPQRPAARIPGTARHLMAGRRVTCRLACHRPADPRHGAAEPSGNREQHHPGRSITCRPHRSAGAAGPQPEPGTA
jgi:hypothetical protein